MKYKSYLTGRSFLLLIFWQVWAVFSLSYGPMLWMAAGMFGLSLLFFWAVWFTLPRPEVFRAYVKSPRALELGQHGEVEWLVAVDPKASLATKGFEVEVRPELNVELNDSRFNLGVCHPGMEYTMGSTMLGKRLGGTYLNQLEIMVVSRLGLWRRMIPVKAEGEGFSVKPSTEPMPEQEFRRLIKNQAHLFMGSKSIMRHRGSDQLRAIRTYRYPDEFRFIDHKKSARYSKLLTRVFDRYQNQHLVIALDTGRSLSGLIDGSSKFDYYRNAALHLIENATHRLDHVSFFSFSEKINLSIKRSNRLESFFPLYKQEDELLGVSQTESNYELIRAGVDHVASNRSVLIILTDASRPSVQKSLLNALGDLPLRHLTVVLSVLDVKYDLIKRVEAQTDQMSPRELGEIFYSYWLHKEHLEFGERLRHLGTGAVVANEKHWLDMSSRVYDLLRTSLRV